MVQNTTESILQRQAKQQRSYDRGSKPLQQLHEGDRVKIQPVTSGQKVWTDGQVVKQVRPRSYEVQADSKVYVRNRRHLRKYEASEDVEPDRTTRGRRRSADYIKQGEERFPREPGRE